jgi:DNA-binding LytR/AlgR family response regulator
VKKITCIIVEDEMPAQRVLSSYISRIADLQLTGTFNNALDAMQFLHSNQVDLLLLDINMPEMSGLEFLETLEPKPAVIITTAYGEYALEGFEQGVTDYLLKPYSFQRFCKAINRCAINLGKIPDKSHEEMSGSIFCNDFISIKVDSGEQKVPVSDVLFIESCGNYLKINCVDHRYVVRETLAGFTQKLPPELFLRVHRSFVVAISKVGKVNANTVLIGDQVIPVGNLYKSALRDSWGK